MNDISHRKQQQFAEDNAPPSYGDHKPDCADFTGSYEQESGDGDVLALLRDFDTVFLVDDSTSMRFNDSLGKCVDNPYNETCRWTEAREALARLAERVSIYDTDGIDIYFLNNENISHNTNLTETKEVQELFSRVNLKPTTFLGRRLEQILRGYMQKLNRRGLPFRKKVKPLNLIVITDGSSDDSVVEPIRSIAMELDKKNLHTTQIGIQFVQIGQSRSARKHLEQVDDDLARLNIRDIADTTPYTDKAFSFEVLTKILVGGINRQYDRRGPDGRPFQL